MLAPLASLQTPSAPNPSQARGSVQTVSSASARSARRFHAARIGVRLADVRMVACWRPPCEHGRSPFIAPASSWDSVGLVRRLRVDVLGLVRRIGLSGYSWFAVVAVRRSCVGLRCAAPDASAPDGSSRSRRCALKSSAALGARACPHCVRSRRPPSPLATHRPLTSIAPGSLVFAW